MHISLEEIDKLNAARTVLKELEKRAREEQWKLNDKEDVFSLGVLYLSAEAAENHNFQVLNVLNSHFGIKITDDQMFNRG